MNYYDEPCGSVAAARGCTCWLPGGLDDVALREEGLCPLLVDQSLILPRDSLKESPRADDHSLAPCPAQRDIEAVGREEERGGERGILRVGGAEGEEHRLHRKPL